MNSRLIEPGTRRTRRMTPTRHALAACTLAAAVTMATVTTPRTLHAQWTTVAEQFYPEGPWNWRFLQQFPAAGRLFNAFDYGHAILYEELWKHADGPVDRLEVREFDRLTKELLNAPPAMPLAEEAIMPAYMRLAPEAKMMFEWAHILHRAVYDILADERLDSLAKERELARVEAAYFARRDLAFSTRPKSMRLMQEQPYSLAFRKAYPKFNGLIWAYHWLQVGLYEPLVVADAQDERQALVQATVARFRQMIANAPTHMPHVMPMTAAIAPTFAARWPRLAIVFDNLHSMHDVISDILANDSVPRNRKRAEILLAAARYRDDTSYVMPDSAWRTMSVAMGLENQGGPAVGFERDMPTPTVTRGAVMRHDDQTGRHIGMGWGEMIGPMKHEHHDH